LILCEPIDADDLITRPSPHGCLETPPPLTVPPHVAANPRKAVRPRPTAASDHANTVSALNELSPIRQADWLGAWTAKMVHRRRSGCQRERRHGSEHAFHSKYAKFSSRSFSALLASSIFCLSPDAIASRTVRHRSSSSRRSAGSS